MDDDLEGSGASQAETRQSDKEIWWLVEENMDHEDRQLREGEEEEK